MPNEEQRSNSSHRFLRVLDSRWALDTKNEFVSLTNVDAHKSPAGSIVYAKVSLDGRRGMVERMPSHIPATEAASDINELLRESNAQLQKNKKQLEDQNHKLEEDRSALEQVRQEVEKKKLEKATLTTHIEAQQTEQGQLTEDISKSQERTAEGRQIEKGWLDKVRVLKSEIEELEHQKQTKADELKRLQDATWKNAVKPGSYAQKLKFLDRHLDETFAIGETLNALRESGYSADKLDLVALHTSLKTAPFTVLAGSSGTGKTSLLRGYTQAMGVNLTTIAVQPNWYSAADLHGYVNPLNDTFYETAFTQALERQTSFSEVDDSGFLDLVLLDEINLSRVEYFLADYLSALEHGEGVELIPAGVAKNESTPEWLRKKGGKITVPKTLLITGTANEDHTTQTFSDKFRDRSAILGVSKSPKIALGASIKIIEPKKRLSHATWHNWCNYTGNTTKLDEHKSKITALLETPKLSVSKRSSQGVWQFFIHAHDLLCNLGCTDAADKAIDLALAARFLQKYVALWKVQEESKRESVDALKAAIDESGCELTRSRAMLESLE